MAVSQKFMQASGKLYTGFQGFWSVICVSEVQPLSLSLYLSLTLSLSNCD